MTVGPMTRQPLYGDQQGCASPKFCPALKSTACTLSSAAVSAMTVLMFRYVELWFGLLTRCLQSRRSLVLENLALRQQLAVLKRKHPRPRMGAIDKIFWVCARSFWGAWKQALVLVNPETVVRWFSTVLELDCEGEKTGR